MAAKEELSWYFVHEEILSKISNVDTFIKASEIWVDRPQVLNRRLTGSYLLETFFTAKCDELFCRVFALRESSLIARDDLLGLIKICESEANEDNENLAEVKIRSLLPRETRKYCNVVEMVVIDKNSKSVTFLPFEENQTTSALCCNIEHAYRVSLLEKQDTHQSLALFVAKSREKGNGITSPTVLWLKSSLLPKLHQWMIEGGKTSSLGQSLRLISVEKYTKKYEELKQKYKHFVKMWPERTDPHKFVYEDVAIASYLLLLWEGEESDVCPQKFIDLGCGNGLLVHILNNEGHKGKGVDLRPRKVWDFYDEKTVLEVCSLDPSSLTYSDVDWLIGNHSDELTPWIPVIAARSSYHCKYLVLPCCFHDFYSKFQRVSANEGQYRSYLSYIENIGKTCGFNVREDIMRIPSTKRFCMVKQQYQYLFEVCQIGQSRIYALEEQELFREKINIMLDNAKYEKKEKTASSYHHDNEKAGQSKLQRKFIPRCDTEVVKNCTKVDRKLLDKIVKKVASELLSRNQDTPTEYHNEDSSNIAWNKGGCLKLSEVSELFDQNILMQLRSEAGGLKTVLRNSHQIFKVQAGAVQIRDWRKYSHSKKQQSNTKNPAGTEKYWKTKHCWFYNHHPDGCPLTSEQCSFAHGKDELRTQELP